MTDAPKRSTVLLAATITDGEKYSAQLEAMGDEVLIVTPRTRNRLRGYCAERVLRTPAARRESEYAAMHDEAQLCLATRRLTVVKS